MMRAIVLGLFPLLMAQAQTMDLHNHLFMEEGLSPLLKGEFYGPLKAKHFEDRFLTKTNAETIEASGHRLVVVALYAHPILKWNARDAIRKQIRMVHEWVSRSKGRWALARTAAEATQALRAGKRVIVLSIEIAAGVLDDLHDVEEFVDREGIRIVTIHHLTGDRYGGTAFLKGLWVLAAPWAYIQSLRQPDFDGPARLNPIGISEPGVAMVRTLMERGVWIDLAHAPDRSYDVILDLHKQARKPLLFTHTALRRYLGAERGLSDRQLKDIATLGGFVGLMPSEDFLEGTPSTPCAGSVHALKVHWNEVARWTGAGRVALGTDFNGGIRHLKPSCQTGTSMDVSGFWNSSQVPVLESLLPIPKQGNVGEFLTLWALAEKH